LFISCKNDQTKVIQSGGSKLFNTTEDCGKDTVFEVDTSKLVVGSVENLDVFNGIKFFRFGSSIESFYPCLECFTLQDIDSCVFKEQLPFLDHEWEFIIYFYKKSLIGVIMKSKSVNEMDLNDVRYIYSDLSDVYGEPNMEPLHIEKASQISKEYYIYTDQLKTMEPYSETRNEIIGSVDISDEEILIKLNSLIKDGSKNDNTPEIYLKTPISVSKHFEYFPEMNLSARWESNKTLKIKMIRDKDLLIWRPEYLYNQYLPREKDNFSVSKKKSKYDYILDLSSRNGYLFYESWVVELLFLQDSLSQKQIDRFRIECNDTKAKRKKVDKKKEIKKVMKEF